MRNSQTQIYVAGNSLGQCIGASHMSAKITEFEPIEFADPSDALNIKSIQCSKSLGRHFILLATFVHIIIYDLECLMDRNIFMVLGKTLAVNYYQIPAQIMNLW